MKNKTLKPLPLFLGLSVLVHGGFLWLVPAQTRPATVFRESQPQIALVNIALPVPPQPQRTSPSRLRPAPTESPAAIVPAETPPERVPEFEGPLAEAQVQGETAFPSEGDLPVSVSPAEADPARREDATLRYLAMIRGLIDRHKEYPYQARRQEQEGTVQVRFTLTRQGTLAGEPALEKKSRHGRLNAAALEAVKNAVPYPPFPAEIADEEMILQVAVNFSLQ